MAREVGHLYEVQEYPEGSAEVPGDMRRRTDLVYEGEVFARRDVWWDGWRERFMTSGFGLTDASEG